MQIETNARRLTFLTALSVLFIVIGIPAVAQKPSPRSGTQSRSSAEPLQDGLYVNGLRLTGGVSHDKVRAKFGPDDERYGQPGKINYMWKFKDGSRLHIEFDSIGSLQSATLAAFGVKRLNVKTFAVLDGKRIVPGQTTLGALRKQFPQGELGKAGGGEGMNFLEYTVHFGGEGSEIMRFNVSWTDLTDATNKTIAQRNRLKVDTIEVGFTNADLQQ